MLEYIPRIECANCTEKSNNNLPHIGIIKHVNIINETRYDCPKGLNSCRVVKETEERERRKIYNF